VREIRLWLILRRCLTIFNGVSKLRHRFQPICSILNASSSPGGKLEQAEKAQKIMEELAAAYPDGLPSFDLSQIAGKAQAIPVTCSFEA
jgi:hypothetical protein